jgi:hypothetical protein
MVPAISSHQVAAVELAELVLEISQAALVTMAESVTTLIHHGLQLHQQAFQDITAVVAVVAAVELAELAELVVAEPVVMHQVLNKAEQEQLTQVQAVVVHKAVMWLAAREHQELLL